MSQQYDNNMRGVLFKNDRKENDRHPDYKGSCEIDGVKHWISAWIKESQKGKFMSLSFQVSEDAAPARPPQRQAPQRQQEQRPQTRHGGGFDDMESDPPF